MPRISYFYGIAIYMYHRDHGPPHFHAILGEHEAIISVDAGALMQGELPHRARSLVAEWARIHREALERNWRLAQAGKLLDQVPPLDRGDAMILRITEVEVCGPHSLRLTFSNDTTKVVDLVPLLRGPIFEPLRDPAYFSQVKLDPICGTVVWPNGADFAPEALHDLEPQEKRAAS